MTLRPSLGFVLAALLAGCGVFNPEDAELSVGYFGPAPPSGSTLQVLATDGGGLRASAKEALEDCRSAAPCLFYRLDTPTDGTLDVLFELDDPSLSGPVASGRVRLPLRPDWRWELSFQPDSTNPLHRCFGCTDAVAFPLPPGWQTGSDSLFVVWAGGSISNPVIY